MFLDNAAPEVDQEHARPCDVGAVSTCMQWLDARTQSHLHGTPGNPAGWACEVCRQALGWPMLGGA